MTEGEKQFYKSVAARRASSTALYGVKSIVIVENQNDIWFWQQVLNHFSFGKVKFIYSTQNEKGNATEGCTQCLKYVDFFSPRFFACIDSDLNYLKQKLPQSYYLIQTYTYSWENHCAYSETLCQNYAAAVANGATDLDFRSFIDGYSKLVYKPLLAVLENDISPRELWQSINIQYNAGDEKDNGSPALEKIKTNIKTLGDINPSQDAIAKYEQMGINEQTAYLYVRGHNIFNTLNAIGRALCGKHYEFTHGVLQGGLQYDYVEMRKIGYSLNAIK